jgi:hypothetical protein
MVLISRTSTSPFNFQSGLFTPRCSDTSAGMRQIERGSLHRETLELRPRWRLAASDLSAEQIPVSAKGALVSAGNRVRGRLRLGLRRRLQLALGRFAAAELAAALSLGVDLGP